MHLSPFFKWLYYLDIEPNTRQKPPVIDSLSKRNGKGLSIAARHCKMNGLVNPISVAGSYPLVEVEYKDRQRKVILTTQGKSTLRILGEWFTSSTNEMLSPHNRSFYRL
jgi:hypothetical protein